MMLIPAASAEGAAEEVQESALAAAGGAGDGDELALGDGEGDAFEDGDQRPLEAVGLVAE